jgi:thymidylate kinase
VVLYLAVSAAVCRERWLSNRRSSARFDVRDEDFANVVARFDEPAEDERAIHYDQSQPLDVWIAQTSG